MASIAIYASMQRAYSSHHVVKKQQSLARRTCTLRTKHVTHVVSVDVGSKKKVSLAETHERTVVHKNEPVRTEGESVPSTERASSETVSSGSMFNDERWKNGTWDLNMFVQNGKMDWDSVIVAEAMRRKFLEVYPETATNQTPVTFRSSIIPWWAWLKRSYLPEAELINGRAAMVGFFMGYFVDVLTGLDVVGQTGNVICKAGLLVTVIGIILFRKAEDIGNFQKLVDEATFYDKQWQATWKDQDGHNHSPNQDKKAPK
ncbi:Light-harvesting complex-like protein 3 isotype 1 protein [Thalictrum thalictroides]|uniref:Light-harvesting complex-like protein 3 isotype 1 protein n=1 Tax=Thalictrum thalictroides TaxID=46969 RepID=A0A7J6VAU9_THATH|nr:Light-harvesting complex-like protein 3 isotype 1 protein [Thalictrum thalictroides]